MVDWKILIMLLLERRPVRVCSFSFDDIILLLTTLFDKHYFGLIPWKNSIVIYFLITSTLMTYMYVVLLKQILQIDT